MRDEWEQPRGLTGQGFCRQTGGKQALPSSNRIPRAALHP